MYDRDQIRIQELKIRVQGLQELQELLKLKRPGELKLRKRLLTGLRSAIQIGLKAWTQDRVLLYTLDPKFLKKLSHRPSDLSTLKIIKALLLLPYSDDSYERRLAQQTLGYLLETKIEAYKITKRLQELTDGKVQPLMGPVSYRDIKNKIKSIRKVLKLESTT